MKRQPRVLVFDIETKYIKVDVYRIGEQVIRADQISEGEKFAIICIAWKWLNKPGTQCMTWDAKHNSAKMLDAFADAVSRADILIGQNIDSFDIKQVNLQRLLYKQPRINWPPTEDTRKLARKHFYLASSSLKYMSKLFGGTGKDRMELQDWRDIIERDDKKAIRKMIKYCKNDVLQTEFTWNVIADHVTPSSKALRIWNSFDEGGPTCPRCQSTLSTSNGVRGRRKRYVCRGCGVCYSKEVKD